MVPTIATMLELAAAPPPGALHVTVRGFQWWWGFEYTGPGHGTDYGDDVPIRTADVLVMSRRTGSSPSGSRGQISGPPRRPPTTW